MSLNSALETISGMGHTAAAQLYDANLARIDAMLWEQRSAMVIGDIQTGSDKVFAAFKFPTDVILKKVEFSAHAGAPVGQDAVLTIKVAGSVVGTATLTQSTDYVLADIISSGSPVTPSVTAGSLVELLFTQKGTTNAGFFVNVTINIQKKCITPS